MDYGSILVSDMTGYNPYSCMLFTTEDYIKNNPDIVKAYVQASIKGWDYYKEHSAEVNEFMMTFNPDATMEWLNFGAEQSRPLIWTTEVEKNGFGYMSVERWQTLLEQMLEGKVIDKEVDVKEAFTTEFLS